MSHIRSSGNSTTELRLRSLLKSTGLRGWRRNYHLLGNPDFVFPDAKLTVFVDGCFWHGHECGRNLKPKNNATAWRNKILKNRSRDRRVNKTLRQLGWEVIRIWECYLRRQPETSVHRIRRALARG